MVVVALSLLLAEAVLHLLLVKVIQAELVRTQVEKHTAVAVAEVLVKQESLLLAQLQVVVETEHLGLMEQLAQVEAVQEVEL